MFPKIPIFPLRGEIDTVTEHYIEGLSLTRSSDVRN